MQITFVKCQQTTIHIYTFLKKIREVSYFMSIGGRGGGKLQICSFTSGIFLTPLLDPLKNVNPPPPSPASTKHSLTELSHSYLQLYFEYPNFHLYPLYCSFIFEGPL